MKLEVQVNVADDAADKVELVPRPRDVVLLGATPPSRSGLRSEPRASASGFAVAPNLAVKDLAEHLRKEAILALFADRKITAGKAAHELGLERLAFMELLKQRGIPYVIYSAEDWAADATAIDEFERRRMIG
jgi:predicted HTH domain antitoxin